MHIKIIQNNEFDNYLTKLNEIQVEKSKIHYEFSLNLKNFKENLKNDFNHLKEFTNYNYTNLKEYNSNFIITNQQLNLNYNYTKKKNYRRSKKTIKEKLQIFFDFNPKKWNNEEIGAISVKTNLPKFTVYKWNWNQIRKIKKFN